MTIQLSEFPSDFVWGTATAAYQIEGAVTEDGRAPSIWDTFTRVPGAIADGSNGDIACDHYHRAPEDVELMSGLGVDAYRFSIAWSRVQPTGAGPANSRGIDFYKRLVESLRDNGITPWVTLYHWDLPQTLQDVGGWLVRDTASRFAEYSALVVTALGDLVDNWITLNEPWCSSFLGYASGVHAPGQTIGTESARAAHHLLLGHGLAVDAIRAAQPAAKVGITLNLYSVHPASDSVADVDAARRIDGLSNRLFLDPVLRGRYPTDVLDDLGQTEWFESQPEADAATIAAPIDFLGINYYSRHTVSGGTARPSSHQITDASGVAKAEGPSAYPGSEHVLFVDAGEPRTQMDWPIVPEGMLEVLRMVNERAPGLPAYITENGSAFEDQPDANGLVADAPRLAYLKSHLDACAEAIREGLPLAGYFVWSLMDNFEWAQGFTRRFGLAYVDYSTQKRTLKESGLWFAELLKSRVGADVH